MNNKAFLRTMEMIFAAVITFVFISFVIPKAATVPEENKLSLLSIMAKDDNFRNCIISQNSDCIESKVREFIPEQYEFVYDVSEIPYSIMIGLPKKEIFVDSYFFSGNATAYKPIILKIYYWRKE